MERTLRNRLFFGSIMLVVMFGLLALDSNAERWTRPWMLEHYGVHYGIGGIGLMLILMLLLPPALTELAALFTAEHIRPYIFIASVGSGALAFHAFLTQFPWFQPIGASTFAFIIVFVMLLAALRRASEKKTEEAIVRMAGTVLATLYLGGLAWFIMAIRVKHAARFSGSTTVVLMILLAVKSTDIGAYFGGRALGRHKLIPWLSPGKTWEGLFFGLVTAALVAMAFSKSIDQPVWKTALFGACIGGIGQLGDLLESLMKRDADVKDSGRLIPGFGGVLDVIDSPLFAAPFAYLWFSFVFRSYH
ncbi:MAG TPA: phosphatidate cytidylyltransferase [Tepidisphaeraceae bacterium]|jgi:phosphatidate cytidylyltransferase|nr:phosphatidate cytidylyltransferase [Tepidisphaeraceae bacterium]